MNFLMGLYNTACQAFSRRSPSQLPLVTHLLQKSMQRLLPSLESYPWLVYPHGKRNENQIFCSLSQPHQNNHRSRIPEFSDTVIIDECLGWFLLYKREGNNSHNRNSSKRKRSHHCSWLNQTEYADISLWNPSKSKSIKLPTLPLRLTEQVRDYALASPPDDPNCKVLLFLSRSILLIRPPFEDKKWIQIPYRLLMKGIGEDDDDDCLHQPVRCNGKLYASSIKRKLVCIEVDEANKVSMQLLCEIPFISTVELPFISRMIESYGQLFFILIRLGGKKVTEVHVLKLDFTTMVWNRTDNLMGQTFFIDGVHAFSSPAIGTKRDTIYFTLPEEKFLYLFNVISGCLSVTLPCKDLPLSWSSPIFLMPEIRLNSYHHNKVVENRPAIDDRKNDNPHMKKTEENLGDLPLDVLNLIANCFIKCDSVFDYMIFRGVSRNFWLAAPKLKLRKLPISPYPWLIFPTSNWCNQNFVDLKHGSKFLMSMTVHKPLAGTRLRYSKDGWLLMSDGKYSVFFYNPFTEQVIDLPALSEAFGLIFSFSSIPTSPDCVVMGFGCCPLRVVAFTMRDKEWHLIVLNVEDYDFLLNVSSPVFHKGAFYLLGETANLVTVGFSEEVEVEYLDIPDKPMIPCESFYRSYLLKWRGKLTSVFVGEMEEWVQVYALNDNGTNWESVQNLGKYTFFLSPWSCVVKKLPRSTGMKNRIYLPRFDSGNILYYSLDTRRLSFDDGLNFSDVRDQLFTGEQLFAGWIDPKYD